MPLPLSNEQQATEFLNYVARKLNKLKKHLRIRLVEYEIFSAHDSDDIMSDTILEVHGTISRNGLSEGQYYNSYFNISLNNSILKHKEKRDKKRWDQTSFEYHLESEENEEDATPISQVLHRIANDDAEEDNEGSGNSAFQPFAPFTEPNDHSEAAKNAHMEAVLATFNTLPDKYREILWMKANGLKYKEIARALNLTIGQVKMRVYSARKLIKEHHNIYPDAE